MLNCCGVIVGCVVICDWFLFDFICYVLLCYFEIWFDGGGYFLIDCSINGMMFVMSGK